jgi:hypothetical protein
VWVAVVEACVGRSDHKGRKQRDRQMEGCWVRAGSFVAVLNEN